MPSRNGRKRFFYETALKMLSFLHCRLIGRPSAHSSPARFLDYVHEFDRVWVCRPIDIAPRWQKHQPYQRA
jgi:allantoinase